MTLSAQEMGSTPKQLFEEAIKAQQHVQIAPGTVVRIKEPLDGIEPGWFVFLGLDNSLEGKTAVVHPQSTLYV